MSFTSIRSTLQTDRQRAAFIKRAAEELGLKEDVIRKDVGRVFLALEAAAIGADPQGAGAGETGSRTSATKNAPKRSRCCKIRNCSTASSEDFDRCGLVGEKTNKLIGYLAAVSRHLESPLAVVVQSSSAAGKSSLMDAVLAFVPEEERIQFSAMTGQSLYYMGEHGSETQGAGHRGRGRRQPRRLCVEAAAKRRRALDRVHRQGSGDGKTGHASVPRRRSGDDVSHHHGHRHRRRTAEPLPGAIGE